MRDIIIGDIHGCSHAYSQLLNRLALDPASDRLILLGDLFDRGPDSWQVFQTVKAQAEVFRERFILLRGNHEDYLLSPRLTLRQRMMWNKVGRKETVRSFQEHGEAMESAAPWLAAHCRMYYKGAGFQCAHACVRVHPIEENDADTLVHDHQLIFLNRYAGPLTIVGHVALPGAAWFVGDEKTNKLLPEKVTSPLPQSGIICIDTGCGKGGKLTGMIIEKGAYTLVSTPE